MPPNNPMTEGEALAVLDADAIASSLVDWMLTKAMPNGDLLHASVACDYAGMANFKRALSKQLRAALREQPEARGVVDELTKIRDEAFRCANADTIGGDTNALKRAMRRLADRCDAALTAAQQPVQEGGGEVCPRCKGAGEYEGFARHASGDPQDEYAATVQCEPCEGTGEVAAPPSAPVGGQCVASPGEEQKPPHTPALRWLDDREGVATQEWQGGFNVAYSYYTQQPAQAAPGVVEFPPIRFIDGMGWAVACSDAVQYVASLRSALRALAQQSNPPGDDAAGGGHG